MQDYWVKPRSADINENVLSEQAREEMGLSEELIRTKGNSLEQVLSQVSSTKKAGILPHPTSLKKKNNNKVKTCWVTLTHALSENSLSGLTVLIGTALETK